MRLASSRRVLALGGVVAVLLAVAAGPASAATPVPYNDLSAAGSITLCDVDGHRVTHGSINDKPFVWMAQSSVAAPAPFNGSGRVAFLSVFQPRKDAYPDRWNGDTMTAASRYTNARVPVTVATPLDYSLAQYIHEFRPLWGGYLQLRMYFGAAGQGDDSGGTYPTADIVVTGTTWTLVRGGAGSCKPHSAVSSEVYESHLKGASATPAPTRAGQVTVSPATSGSGQTPSGSASSDPTQPALAAGADPVASSGSSAGVWLSLGIVLLLLVAGSAVYVLRRRDR